MSSSWSWKDFAYIGSALAMFGTFIGIAALSAAGSFTGGAAAGLLVTIAVLSIINIALAYKYYMIHNIYIYQIIGTCVALFFSLSAAQIAYMNQVVF
jgi:hypothetical protein